MRNRKAVIAPRVTAWQEHVTTALRHGLVRPGGEAGHFRFVHALIATRLYQQLSPTERTNVHAGIARALQRISIGRPTPPDLLARHCTRGWPAMATRDAVDALLTAARAIGAQLDFARAAEFYQSAALPIRRSVTRNLLSAMSTPPSPSFAAPSTVSRPSAGGLIFRLRSVRSPTR